jgi:hypothetical protein
MRAQSAAFLAAIRIFPPPGIAFQRVCDQVDEHPLHTGARHPYFDPLRYFEKNVDTLMVRSGGCVFTHSSHEIVQIAVFNGRYFSLRHADQIGQQFPHSTCSPADVESEPVCVIRSKIEVDQHFGTGAG